MSDTITVRDVQGDLVIGLDDMRKYHGQDFDNGLSMALKACQLAFGALTGGRPPDRDRKSTRLNFSHVSESRMPSSA